MRDDEMIQRCVDKLGMSRDEARWVADHLYDYEMPDFSEMSWREIDEMFRGVLWFKDKTDEEIDRALLCAS